MRRVVITGFGAVSPIGGNLTEFANRILTNESAIKPRRHLRGQDERLVPVAVAESNEAAGPAARRPAGVDRSVAMAIRATERAVQEAGLANAEAAPLLARALLCVGSGAGSFHMVEASFGQWHKARDGVHPFSVLRGLHNAAAAELSIRFGIRGPSRTFAMACASGAAALANAVEHLRAGRRSLAVVCATEAPLSEAMLDGWLAMRIYADCDEGAHNAIPFGTGRGGIALGEAAVCMIVEELDSALARGAQPLAEIVGVGESSDAHSLVKPHVEGQIEAMRAALADGGIRPSDVGYVNAHATGTSVGDPTEAQAIAEVFPDRPWVSSTKGLHGHTLGAAGLLELGVVIAGMKSSLVPAGFGLEAIGSDCAELRHVTTVTAWPEGLSCAMSNSFAFGGHNVSIVVRRV